MTDFVIETHQLDDRDSDTDDFDIKQIQPIAPIKPEKQKHVHFNIKPQEPLPIDTIYELDPNEILRLMQQAKEFEEQQIQQQKQNQQIGSKVDIYLPTLDEWISGTISKIKGDKICILYQRKIKWIHKNSQNWCPHQQKHVNPLTITPSFTPTVCTTSEFSSIALEEDSNARSITYTPSFSSVMPPDICTFDLNENHSDVSPPSKQNRLSSVDSYEYDVTFYSKTLGLTLCPYKDGINCVVSRCNNNSISKTVEIGSIICAINGKNVFGLSFSKIREIIKHNMCSLPMCITFKSKVGKMNYKQINNVNERGLLQIKVVNCIQLERSASYVGIQVGNAYLTTKQIKNNCNPEWNEVLLFRNFRCDHGKKAKITIYNKCSILKDKKVASVMYELPIRFNERKQDKLDVKNENGESCGVIMLNVMIVP
eukprot:346090_1